MNTLLNVVRHPGGKFRFGVINEEYLLEPRPARIRITNLPDREGDIVVNPGAAFYANGSIFSREINDWLRVHYPREAEDPIWLLKFEFTQNENEHVYSFVGNSGYRKQSRHSRIIAPDGREIPASRNSDLSAFIWQA